ncbi:MAG: hypothetical protein B7733_22965 [Myxococcales bacterium FL481]|nr:MAG: hypothetical protein B7733_22965 [Myxococcales bacterium FL481]
MFTSRNIPPNEGGFLEGELDPKVASFDTLYVKAAGQVLADGRRYGVRYEAEGRLTGRPRRRDVLRRKSRGWEDVEERLQGLGWGEERLAEVRELARVISPERKVHRLRVRPTAWAMWVELVDALGDLQEVDAVVEGLAACRWWEGEELAERQRCQCGTRTVEHSGFVPSTGQWISRCWRMLCESWRCPHCARVHQGAKVAARLRAGWDQARSEGRWLWFVTLTVDWEAYFEKLGVSHWSVDAKRAAAWSQIGVMCTRLVTRDLSRAGLDLFAMWARKSEKHDSGFPHLHLMVSLRDDDQGEGDLGSLALREAGCRTTTELLERLEEWRSDPEYVCLLSTWNERVSAWEESGREGRRPRKPYHPRRLPFSQTRQRLHRAAKRSGFGHLDLKPVDPETFGTAHDPLLYFAKPCEVMSQLTSIPDTGLRVVGAMKEYSKAVQVEGALPSGVRVVGWSRAWPQLTAQEEPEKERVDPETSTFAIHSASIEQVRGLAEARGWPGVGEVTRVDFHGPIPDRGERRPVSLVGFCVEGVPGGLTLADDELLVEEPGEASTGEPAVWLPGLVPSTGGLLVGGGSARGPPRGVEAR